MKYLLNAEQMKQIDTYSIQKTGIPSLVLMERAALQVTEAVLRLSNDKDTILCVCGKGNNGADGLCVARQLSEQGRNVEVYIAGSPDKKGTEESQLQLQILKNLGICIRNNVVFDEYTFIVDALFGIGLSRDITGEYADLIEQINHASSVQHTTVISIDVPSGINASDGSVMAHAVRADETITFGYQKIGMVRYPGKMYAGNVTVAQIGFNPYAIDQVENKAFTLTDMDLNTIPPRPEDSNKGTFGKVLIIAGSEHMGGAACLSAMAAYRAGCGLVHVYTHSNNRNVIMTNLPEAIVTTYTDEDHSTVSSTDSSCTTNQPDLMGNHSDDNHIALSRLLDWSDCVIAGPGIGMGKNSYDILKCLLDYEVEHKKSRLILDADALNLIAAHQELAELLRKATTSAHSSERCMVIVTPHMGEMARLTGQSISDLKLEPEKAAVDFAKQYGVVCVLKDAVTVVSDGENVYYNTVGNSGMATAGCGDVLTGVIAGMLETGMEHFQAACMGVYVHAKAGDLAASQYGKAGLKASDIANTVALVLK